MLGAGQETGRQDPEKNLTLAAGMGMRATAWGIVASAVLAAVKVIAGIVGHSYALVADGIESMLDIMSSVVVWGSLRIASQPATDQYPYGFGKAESLAALAVATALLAAALGITVQSIIEIRTPQQMPAPFTLGVLIFVIVAKEVMFRVLYFMGRKVGSQAMQTDAWHHRSDSLTSIAALIGISIALIGGEGYESADDWAALFAAGVIAFNGSRLFRSALREILDVAPSPELVEQILKVARAVPDVEDLHRCRVRRSGLILFVDLQVIVNRDLTVYRGHEIAHEVKDALLAAELGIRDVNIHVEPSKP